MVLSDEQMSVVQRGHRTMAWSHVDLPVGPQPTPDWALGLNVDFADGYGNSPRLAIKTNTNLRKWPDQRFTFKDGLYLSESTDGRAEAHYHGPASMVSDLTRWIPPQDGEPGRREVYSGWATQRSEGYGGAIFDIVMEDGREVALRGPWHGPCPDGFVEVAFVDVTQTFIAGRDWRNCGGMGGLLLRHELFIRLFARFAPHLRLVAIREPKRTMLEPIKPEWDCPKAAHLEREHQAAITRGLKLLAAQGGDATSLVGGEPWLLISMRDVQVAEIIPGGDWRNPIYRITDTGRAALARALGPGGEP